MLRSFKIQTLSLFFLSQIGVPCGCYADLLGFSSMRLPEEGLRTLFTTSSPRKGLARIPDPDLPEMVGFLEEIY